MSELLQHLRSHGLTVSEPERDRWVIGPRERLTPELREWIAVHRADIIVEALQEMYPDPGFWSYAEEMDRIRREKEAKGE